MPFPILAAAAVGGAVASYFGQKETNTANAEMQQNANESNAEQARLNREWQERMSNTAHQREVEDLKKAGLNPILSTHGGASTPSGSTANFSAARQENQIGAAVSSARESAALTKELESKDSAINLNNASAVTQTAVQEANYASAKSATETAARTQQDTIRLMRENRLGNATIKSAEQSARIQAETELKKAQIDSKFVTTDKVAEKMRNYTDTLGSAKDLLKPWKSAPERMKGDNETLRNENKIMKDYIKRKNPGYGE